ncbi:MAG: hypothetical protein ABR879_08750 [Methanomassiliicoccales archaeon]|jgi:hypothetical protein
MVSKRQKIAVALVVVILALAGGLLLAVSRPASQTAAERLALTPADVGKYGYQTLTGWSSFGGISNYSSEYLVEMENSTVVLFVTVAVSNATSDCHAAYEEWRATGNSSVNISLGDEAFYQPPGNTTISVITFTRSNVMAAMQTGGDYGRLYPWQYNATLDIALLQLEKIDANLPI